MHRNPASFASCFSVAFLLAGLLLSGCRGGDPVSPAKTPGTLSVRIRVAAGSPFRSIAKSGDITVRAPDITPLTAPLTLGDSIVEGKVAGIPTGKDRIVALKVYDSSGTARYHAEDTVDIFADSTTALAVTLIRYAGSVIVTGTVSDSLPASTAWDAPTRVTLGAQASVYGAVLDIDTRSSWMSATANADQGGIDLVLQFYGGAFHLDNAVHAKAAGIANNIPMTNFYDDSKIKDLPIVKVTAKPADQEAARAAFAAGSKIQGMTIQAGDMFLAESTGGKLALITVTAIYGSDRTGKADLDVTPLTIP
jgi:hypothetical protein